MKKAKRAASEKLDYHGGKEAEGGRQSSSDSSDATAVTVTLTAAMRVVIMAMGVGGVEVGR